MSDDKKFWKVISFLELNLCLDVLWFRIQIFSSLNTSERILGQIKSLGLDLFLGFKVMEESHVLGRDVIEEYNLLVMVEESHVLRCNEESHLLLMVEVEVLVM